MSKICHSCNKKYGDSHAFCAECGSVLFEEQPAQAAQQQVYQSAPQASAQSPYQAAPQAASQSYQPQYTAQNETQPLYTAQDETQPLYQYQQQYQPTPAPTYQAAPTIEPKKEELYPAVSTATYFWLNIAMAIPFVGLILSIVLSFAPRNRSLKNYSRAYLIANIIVLSILLIGFILFYAFANQIAAFVFDMLNDGVIYNQFPN